MTRLKMIWITYQMLIMIPKRNEKNKKLYLLQLSHLVRLINQPLLIVLPQVFHLVSNQLKRKKKLEKRKSQHQWMNQKIILKIMIPKMSRKSTLMTLMIPSKLKVLNLHWLNHQLPQTLFSS